MTFYFVFIQHGD